MASFPIFTVAFHTVEGDDGWFVVEKYNNRRTGSIVAGPMSKAYLPSAIDERQKFWRKVSATMLPTDFVKSTDSK